MLYFFCKILYLGLVINYVFYEIHKWKILIYLFRKTLKSIL